MPHGSKSSNLDKIREAKKLLRKSENDAAIDVLRSKEAPNDAELCALLAQAYFQRGDTRGDVYSSHYFARRTLELGKDDTDIQALLALTAFKKEQYGEAVEAFSAFVTKDSPAASQFMYGMALIYGEQPAKARRWINRAAKLEPANDTYRQATADLRKILANGHGNNQPHLPRTGNMYTTITEAQTATGKLDIDAPYKQNAVSKLRGDGTAPKDFHWLEENIPCQRDCPAATNIPEYLAAIYAKDYDRAYRINLWDNIFPAVLGRVCSRPCEEGCRHGWEDLGESVAICFSKRSAADFKTSAPVALEKIYRPTGKRVAVVGAGVAGLAAARNLALFGHDVVVYEKHTIPGGMMNQGIPEFRLPRDYIDREVEQVRLAGVKIVCGTAIGRDIPLPDLVGGFDAVVMAAGTLLPNILDLPGNDLKGIRHGLDFLLEANDTNYAEVGRNVIVIGGGFTAMDCARTAIRLGADNVRVGDEEPRVQFGATNVRVAYRRSATEMLVTPGEIEELNNEGIPMEFMVSPVAFVGDRKGNVKKMSLIHTELGEPDESGRRRPIPIAGSEFEVLADTVLLATGQFPDTRWIDEALKDDLVADDDWLKSGTAHKTAHPKIFVAGDFATGALTLIDAIGHAKDCARAVDTWLMGEKRVFDVARVENTPGGSGRIREMDVVPLQPMPTIPLSERTLRAEVEAGFDQTLAVDETQRCYMCHYKYEIDNDKCIYCDWCIKAKPRPDCIVKVSDLVYDDDDRIVGFTRTEKSEDTKFIYINQEDCIRCNLCVDACPVDCISIQKVSLQQTRKDGSLCCAY